MIDPRNPDYANTPGSSTRPQFQYVLSDRQATPAVTILTPFFSADPVFQETARTVFAQSFQQWEWLIVNDGSTEPAALKLLAECRQRDPRIRVIEHDVSQGPAAARNAGFDAATTDYVYLLDAEGLLEPTALEKTFWLLESHPEYAAANGWSVDFGAEQRLRPVGFERREEFLRSNPASIQALVRRSAHAAVGGFDPSLRDGMEVWDFWLRLADHGLWGATIPEYLTWHRHRDDNGNARTFAEQTRKKYERLFTGGFPRVVPRWHMPFDPVRTDVPDVNRLSKTKPRLLLIVPWLRFGGSDKFNLDLVSQLTRRGWEVTLVATLRADHAWTPDFARFTPDIFILPNFLRATDHPAFLRYLIQSRQPDVVCVSNSELGYLLLPYLRSYCPEPAYVDYCHMEEEHYKHGGFPRHAIGNQYQLDLHMVTSEHLKRWMVKRNGDPARIEVAYINVDPEQWTPDAEVRRNLRREYEIADEETVLLYAVRICPQKQPRVFARVMAELAERGLRFRTLVAGDGEDRPWLEQFLQEHELRHQVHMLGVVTSERVRDLLRASDIYFLPSQWEGIALGIYEAMSVGLAILGADVGGQRELVTPECGILIPRGDEDSEVQRYSEELARLLSDREHCLEMGRRARQRVATHFHLDAMGDRMAALLEKAREWKTRQPRETVGQGLAHELATQAVELVRVTEVLDRKWAEVQHLQEVAAERDRLRATVAAYERRFLCRVLRRTGLLR